MNSDIFFGIVIGMFASLMIGGLFAAFKEDAREQSFKDDCQRSGGVVLRLEGKQICLPPQVLEMQR